MFIERWVTNHVEHYDGCLCNPKNRSPLFSIQMSYNGWIATHTITLVKPGKVACVSIKGSAETEDDFSYLDAYG